MRISFWDVLSILGLLAICVLGAVFTSIFVSPNSIFNPFPPAALPPLVEIPTSTPTLLKMPPTWTSLAGDGYVQTATLAPSQTMPPTSTFFQLPTFTLTPTQTYTPSNTPTVTLTRTPTKTLTRTITKTNTVANTATLENTQTDIPSATP